MWPADSNQIVYRSFQLSGASPSRGSKASVWNFVSSRNFKPWMWEAFRLLSRGVVPPQHDVRGANRVSGMYACA